MTPSTIHPNRWYSRSKVLVGEVFNYYGQKYKILNAYIEKDKHHLQWDLYVVETRSVGRTEVAVEELLK